MRADQSGTSGRTQEAADSLQEGDRIAVAKKIVHRLLELDKEAPKAAVALFFPGLTLESESREDAYAELKRRVYATDADRKLQWVLDVDPRSDGRLIGYANPYISSANADIDTAILSTFSALLTGLNVHRLTALWRASEFGEAFLDAFAKRRMLTAAACARSLLEGAAAFAGSTQKILASWDHLKAQGRPSSHKDVGAFYDEFRGYLHVAQHGSRIDGLEKHAPKATNIMTHVEKIAKVGGDKVKQSYHWLSDAVHGSFGSITVYYASRHMLGGGSVVTVNYARDPLAAAQHETALATIVPEQALEATIFSGELVIADLDLVRWLIDDIGLTTGLAFRSAPSYPGHAPSPERNKPCPCGSGRKFKKCVHAWGENGTPPNPRTA